jgi:DNA ligase-1
MSYWLMKPLSIGQGKKDVSPEDVIFPGYASRKLDGIRACIKNGVVLSNSKKPIASKLVQKLFGFLENLDGELGYGDPTDPLFYNKTQSAVNSIEFPEDFDPDLLCFYVFDYRISLAGTCTRLSYLENMPEWPRVKVLEQTLVHDFRDLERLYNQYVAEGYEGIMYKRVGAHYKEGRSGKLDQPLLRIKPFGNEFFEAQIIGYECAYQNDNDAYIDEQGFTKRSSHRDNLVPLDMLGAFVVKDCKTGVEFRLPASAMAHADRIALWKKIDDCLGRYVRYTCLTYGAKEKPRMPSFRGFRSTTDFSPTGEF